MTEYGYAGNILKIDLSDGGVGPVVGPDSDLPGPHVEIGDPFPVEPGEQLQRLVAVPIREGIQMKEPVPVPVNEKEPFHVRNVAGQAFKAPRIAVYR